MFSSEDPNKSSSIHDSQSPSQPLLSIPYPPQSIEEPIIDPHDSDRTQYLQISYNFGPRQFKNITFLILFAFLVLSSFALGIFAVFNRNPNSSHAKSYTYDANLTSCVKSYNQFNHFSHFSFYRSRSAHLSRYMIWTLVITSIISLPFGLVILLCLKHYTKQLVYISVPFYIIIPVFLNVYWFAACTISSTCTNALPLAYRILLLVFLFLIIGVLVWIIVSNWHQIQLAIQIISVSSNALLKNLGLFVVLPGLTLVLLAYFLSIVVFLVLALSNGKIVARLSSGEYECVWKQDSWVPAFYALAILTMVWSATTMLEAQVYVISGTIAQWYFSKDDAIIKRPIRSSLRNAFGPSFGTVCLSGLLVCIVRVVRAIVDSAGREDAVGIVNLMFRCCVNALLSTVDFLNKFTINFAAIMGESYCLSARMTYELLKRNLLSAVFVEAKSTRLLVGIVFVLSAIYTIAVCTILKTATYLGDDSYIVAAFAWVLLIVVLGFSVLVLDYVIDTIYVCYAIDRDKGEVCKQEIHEVYVNLPTSRIHRPSLVP